MAGGLWISFFRLSLLTALFEDRVATKSQLSNHAILPSASARPPFVSVQIFPSLLYTFIHKLLRPNHRETLDQVSPFHYSLWMPDQDYREARILEVLEITEHPAANFQGRLWQIKVRVHSMGEEFETSISRLFQSEAEALKAGDIVLL